jgi:phage terminase large subunit GpA-like protein
MRSIMDAVTDPAVREVVMCTGIQLGKTELLLNAICYYMLQEPSPILLVEPSEDLYEDIGCDRVDAMIRSNPELCPLFGLDGEHDKSKKTGRLKIDIKRFPGGFLKLASAASPTDLKSRPIRIILCDEVDTFPARSDGNAVDMAIGRSTNFVDSKVLLTSSPGALQSSEIWRRLGACAVHEFEVPCPLCGEYSIWSWQMVKWDKDTDGVGDASTARMECPHCGGYVRGPGVAPYSLLSAGRWRCTSGSSLSGKMGYRLPGLYSPWKPLSEIVLEWLAASQTRDIDRLRTFIQDRLAEPWEDRPAAWHDTSAADPGFSRFELEPDHSTIRYLTAGVDVQRDRVEVSVWGYGISMESWAISHHVFSGDVLSARVWDEVRALLTSPIRIADGREGHVFSACVDSGDGYSTQTVYRFCSELAKYRVVAIKGVGGENVPMVASPSRTPTGTPLYKLGVDRLKRVIYDRIGIRTVGPGYIHIPDNLGGEFWEQLTAESPETVIEHGRTVTRWRKTRARNEALDCAVYAYAAYELFCHPNFKKRK